MKKTRIYLTLIIISLFVLAQAQSPAQEKKSGTAKEKAETSKTATDKTKDEFTDFDCNELADSTVSSEKKKGSKDTRKRNRQRRRVKDHFIDLDGDGINDNRCRGMGFQCGKGRKKCKKGK